MGTASALRNEARFGAARKMSAIGGVLLFHLLCYILVNLFNGQRPASQLHDFRTRVDDWIPYLGWTWFFYYIGVPYMTGWAMILAAKLPDDSLRAALQAYIFMILTGNVLQLMFPAHSPWPQEPVPFQHFVHTYISYDPYVCLPSMHVAFSVMPAALSLDLLESPWSRFLSVMLAALILVSTLTLKEHYFLDLVAGMALGLGAYSIYQWKAKRPDSYGGFP